MSVAWAADKDLDLDLLVTGEDREGAPVANVYRNDGEGGFIDIHAGLTAVKTRAVAWGDCDSDGNLDILLAGRDHTGNANCKSVP